MITSMGLNTIRRSKKKKKARYAIINVSLKEISKIIKELRSCLMSVMCGRGSNMNLPTVTFIYEYSLLSVL